MKKICLILIILCFTPSLFSQNNNIPAGEYFAMNAGVLFSFTVTADGSYSISMADGKLETINGELKLNMNSVEVPTFGIKYETRGSASDSLTIKFDDSFQSYFSNYILIGTKNTATDVYDYKMLTNVLEEQRSYGKTSTEFKVAKTKYISLLEDKTFNGENEAFNYTIPDDVSTISINYNFSTDKLIKLTATYDADQEIVTVGENGASALVFRKDYKKYISGFETPTSTEKNIRYEGLENGGITEYDAYDDYENTYKFKIQQFDDYKKALQKNKEEKKILIVFNLPENETSKKEFEDFIKDYELYLSSIMYDKYNATADQLNFYLAKDGDKSLKKQFNLEENTMVALVDDGEIIFKQKADFKTTSGNFLEQSVISPNFKQIYLIKRLDVLITTKKFDENEAQQIFAEFSRLNNSGYYAGSNLNIMSDYDKEQYKNDGAEIYKRKASQSDIDSLYEKLVNSHKNDTNVDFQFADLASKMLPNYNEMYADDAVMKPLTTSDLDVIDYLLKFKTELKNYEPVEELENKNGNYYFYDMFPYTIETALKNGIEDADAEKLQSLKPRFEKLYDSKTDYLYFLQTYIPNEFLTEYQKMYYSNFSGNKDVILQLNDIYETSNNDNSWKAFKASVASQANSAAWSVVLDKNNNSFLKDAVKWSKTSLEIDAENPYYLDTLAQLLYLNGDKEEAITTQELAVKFQEKILLDLKKAYRESSSFDDETLHEMKETLAQFKNETYIQKENPQN